MFKHARLTRDNYASMLSGLVTAGDVIIDLSWNVETYDILAWCGEHDVRYLNTSLEEWIRTPTSRTSRRTIAVCIRARCGFDS